MECILVDMDWGLIDLLVRRMEFWFIRNKGHLYPLDQVCCIFHQIIRD